MDAALVDMVRSELVARFGDHCPQVGEGTRAATFACASGSLGDVVVDADDVEVTIGVVGMWHGHFDQGPPDSIVAACARFLDDLFRDRIVIWVTREGERVVGGGCFYRDRSEMPPVGSGVPHDARRVRPPDGSRAATWSGPWVDG